VSVLRELLSEAGRKRSGSRGGCGDIHGTLRLGQERKLKRDKGGGPAGKTQPVATRLEREGSSWSTETWQRWAARASGVGRCGLLVWAAPEKNGNVSIYSKYSNGLEFI
jgi:hypothetical protein